MKLATPSDSYRVHFWYEADKLGRRRVRARVHHGECVGKPCSKLYHEGIATCSRRDFFVRSVGRKLALQKALANYAKEIRKGLWLAYWQLSRPPRSMNCSRPSL